MAMISVGQPRDDLRWFQSVDPERETSGLWHLGKTKLGKTWPAGPALCGYDQPDKAVGRHKTSVGPLAHEQDFCPACLRMYQAMMITSREGH